MFQDMSTETYVTKQAAPVLNTAEEEKKRTDSIIADLQKQLKDLRLKVEVIEKNKGEQREAFINKLQKHEKKKTTKWTAFSKHMMSFLNDVLASPHQEIKAHVIEELKLDIKQNTGDIFSQYNDKDGNIILLKSCNSYAGNVQGIMKHCGQLWQNLSGDSKNLWQEYSEKCNNGLAED